MVQDRVGALPQARLRPEVRDDAHLWWSNTSASCLVLLMPAAQGDADPRVRSLAKLQDLPSATKHGQDVFPEKAWPSRVTPMTTPRWDLG